MTAENSSSTPDELGTFINLSERRLRAHQGARQLQIFTVAQMKDRYACTAHNVCQTQIENSKPELDFFQGAHLVLKSSRPVLGHN